MIEATAAELRTIALAAGDATGYFAAMYARVTARIAGAIDSGRFEDGERMDRFATTFADFYVRALRDRADAPACWRASWAVAGDSRLLIIQHLLLGINAHVNHDLAQAVVEVAGPDPGGLAAVRPDFDGVNTILAETYTELVTDLDRVSRWAAEADLLLGPRVFNFSLARARDQAWSSAERIHGLDPADRPRAVAELDRMVSVVSYLITRPPRVLWPLLRIARCLEQRDPRVVATTLLGDAGDPG